jgi:hypothetical protein
MSAKKAADPKYTEDQGGPATQGGRNFPSTREILLPFCTAERRILYSYGIKAQPMKNRQVTDKKANEVSINNEM